MCHYAVSLSHVDCPVYVGTYYDCVCYCRSHGLPLELIWPYGSTDDDLDDDLYLEV